MWKGLALLAFVFTILHVGGMITDTSLANTAELVHSRIANE
jgi:hypothetical protein